MPIDRRAIADEFCDGSPVRLEPLYRVRFTYPEGWTVALEGGWEQHFFLAEGTCEGAVTGRFRGVNFPLRRTAVGPFVPDFRAVHRDRRRRDDHVRVPRGTAAPTHRGGGRSSERSTACERRRQLSAAERCRLARARVRCARPADPGQQSSDLVLDVAELIWEPIAN